MGTEKETIVGLSPANEQPGMGHLPDSRMHPVIEREREDGTVERYTDTRVFSPEELGDDGCAAMPTYDPAKCWACPDETECRTPKELR